MMLRSPVTLSANNNRGNGTIEILQISDLHLLSEPTETLLGLNTEETAHQVFNLARSKTWPPDLIVLTGDIAQEPLPGTYQRLKRFLNNLDVPVICLPGNHDNPQIMLQELQSKNIHCASQVVLDNWQIICLDSSVQGSEAGHFSDESFKLLQDHLAEYPTKYALVCLHHPPLSIACAWLDTMVLDNNNAFFDILESHSQARAIICGHIHQNLDTTHGNLRILGTPSTCFQFKPASKKFALDNKAPGYRHLTLCPDGEIHSQVFRLDQLPKGLDLSSQGY